MQPIARGIANFLCVFEKRTPGGVLYTTIYYDSRALKSEVAENRIVVGHRELFAVAEKRLGDYACFVLICLKKKARAEARAVCLGYSSSGAGLLVM